MTKFILLHRRTREESVLINLSHIIEISPGISNGCFVRTTNGEIFYVKETFQEVRDFLDKRDLIYCDR